MDADLVLAPITVLGDENRFGRDSAFRYFVVIEPKR
jgi:hypothetical protein